jgi:phosphodiesterase/alkaline phosphatase D-like protein
MGSGSERIALGAIRSEPDWRKSGRLKSESRNRGTLMTRSILTSVFLTTIAVLAVAIASSIRGDLEVNPAMAAVPPHQLAQFTAGPDLENVTEASAIIRWTGANPGGTALHYGVVHYGTSAMKLTEVAKSPNRRNLSNPDMTFRVHIGGLNAHTTYYYTVESAGATGASDGGPSPVKTFQTK